MSLVSKEKIRAYLPELIYGANDGVVTTLAIVSGVVGANLSSTVILILGFANLFADGVSMAASNILSQRSHADHMPTLRQTLPRGSATFVGFLVAGLAPLIAYLIPWPDAERFALSVTLASVTLFAVGAGRAWVTPRHWFAAGLEMLLIGIGAGMIAYGVGALGAWLTGGVM